MVYKKLEGCGAKVEMRSKEQICPKSGKRIFIFYKDNRDKNTSNRRKR